MAWESHQAREQMRDQFRGDRGRRSRFYGDFQACLHTNLVWPHSLVVGTTKVGRVALGPGWAFREKNLEFEAKFMEGKIDRLWAWRVAYGDELNRVSSTILDRLIVPPGSRLTDAVQKAVEELGLEFCPRLDH